MPAKFPTTCLHHVALGAFDVEKVAAFYECHFRLTPIGRHYQTDGSLRSIWLNLAPGILMIERMAESPRRLGQMGSGPFLVAFCVSDLDSFEAELSQVGVAIESRSEWSRYFRDPEGNRVAVSCYPLP